MSMQEPFSELMRVGRMEGAERRRLDILHSSGEKGNSIKVELSHGTARNSTSDTGLRTVSKKGTITVEVEEEDDKVMFEMEKGPRERLPSQTPAAAATKYRSRWMRRKQMNTMARQITATEPEILAIKMESMNLKAIAKKREKEIQAEILSGTLRQERLKKQLEECSRNRCQASATATNADGGTSCHGATASRRTADADDNNTEDWQAELLHDVDEDTFEKLDGIAADLDEMATRERWLFCRSCKSWHTVPSSKTSSKFLMPRILGLLLQTRPINAADMQGKGDYSIADSHGVAVYEHRYDAVLDASTSIIVIEMPFLRLRAEMGKLRTAMEKASKEYDQERELYAGLQEEQGRFETMLSSTVDLLQSKMSKRRGLWQNGWEGYWAYTIRSRSNR
jgi:hypothetical protein